MAGAVCALAVGLKFRIGLDDSLDVVAVHFVGGLWGTLSLGFFALPSAKTEGGLFYGGGLAQFWPQMLTALIVTAWSAVMTTLIGFAIHKTMGMRVSEADERLRHRRHGACRNRVRTADGRRQLPSRVIRVARTQLRSPAEARPGRQSQVREAEASAGKVST